MSDVDPRVQAKMLRDLLDDGLLTEEVYREKMAALRTSLAERKSDGARVIDTSTGNGGPQAGGPGTGSPPQQRGRA